MHFQNSCGGSCWLLCSFSLTPLHYLIIKVRRSKLGLLVPFKLFKISLCFSIGMIDHKLAIFLLKNATISFSF